MYKLDLEKAEGQEIKLPTSTESQKNQGNSRKNINFASFITQKPLCRSQQTEKFLQRWEYQTIS